MDHDLKHAHELRQAAFKLYASLGSNDEDIRKKVLSLMVPFQSVYSVQHMKYGEDVTTSGVLAEDSSNHTFVQMT